jgi:aryl-alcohol dehydrogenase-like predicted oxidoreductase
MATIQRRHFIKSTVAGALAAHSYSALAAQGEMPTRTLGKSGLEVSRFCLGGFHMAKAGKENAIRMIHRSMDLGVTFFDSAHKYHNGLSDEYYGAALDSARRQKVLLMSKAQLRDAASAMKQLEDTLRRMKTDYLDLWQCHEVSRMDEVEKIFGPDGSLEAFVKAKKQGKVRHIGFTGHHDPDVHLALLGGYDGWETVQHPVNLVDPHYRSFVKNVLLKVDSAGLGKIAMKTNAMGPILDNHIASIEECLRFAMAQQPDTIVSGVETVEQLDHNVSVIKHMKPLTSKQVKGLLTRTGDGPVGPGIEPYKRKDG